jgi:hypothetical protein
MAIKQVKRVIFTDGSSLLCDKAFVPNGKDVTIVTAPHSPTKITHLRSIASISFATLICDNMTGANVTVPNGRVLCFGQDTIEVADSNDGEKKAETIPNHPIDEIRDKDLPF